MSEIKKELIKLKEGDNYKASGEDYVITENHSINDVIRWVLGQMQNEGEELKFLIDSLHT